MAYGVEAWRDELLWWFSARVEGLGGENGVTLSVTLKRKKGLIRDYKLGSAVL